VLTKLYTNDGNGIFTEVNNTPFPGVTAGSIDFADVDGDNDADVLITGDGAKLFKNDGAGNFTEVLNTPFPVCFQSSAAISDIDGDNYPEILITGAISAIDFITKLYKNDGSGNYTEVPNTPFEGVVYGKVS